MVAVSFRATEPSSDQQPEEIHGNISSAAGGGAGLSLSNGLTGGAGAFNLKVWDFYTEVIVLLLLFFNRPLSKLLFWVFLLPFPFFSLC